MIIFFRLKKYLVKRIPAFTVKNTTQSMPSLLIWKLKNQSSESMAANIPHTTITILSQKSNRVTLNFCSSNTAG